MFGPNYGAAQSHIAELMQERDDFLGASRAQAARIAELEASLASANESASTSMEQLDLQTRLVDLPLVPDDAPR